MIKMEKYKCPYCGREIKKEEIEFHMNYKHPEVIKKEEMEMLSEMKRQQYFMMSILRERDPFLYIQFLEELSKEENIEIKIMCVEEFFVMDEKERAEKIIFEILENGGREEYMKIFVLYKNMGEREKAIDVCKKGMEKFEDDREKFSFLIEEMEG